MAISGLNTIQTEDPVDQDVLYLFSDITNIPRPSKKEEAILSFVIEKLRKTGDGAFQIEKDSFGNMAIHIAANDEKYRNSPRVVIQGHADMVCHNGNDQRPVNAKVDGDRIIAPDETLGADNAIGGIAIPLAILRNQDFKHGPITFLLTVQEEIGMAGAASLDPKLIPDDSAVFINIDSEEGPSRIFYGSAGGSRMSAQFDISEKMAVPDNYDILQISLSGFPGGHSGLTIYQKPKNAIKEMVALLLELQANSDEDFMLMQISGGENSNDVPKTSMAQIAVPKSQRAALEELIDVICLREQRQMERKCLERSAEVTYVAISNEIKDNVLNALNEIPQGPINTDPENKDHVITSNNIAILRTLDDTIDILDMVRSNEDSELDQIEDQIREILERYHVQNTNILRKYYRWREDKNSRAIKLMQAASRQVTGKEPTLEEAHCGLETGTIARRILPRTIPMGSFGPKIGNAHGEGEYVLIKDILDTRKMLECILTSVAESSSLQF